MTVSQEIFDDLWDGEKSIGFFVHSGKCFWIVDEKCNFTLDIDMSLRASLQNGNITQEQYERSSQKFRGGVVKILRKISRSIFMIQRRKYYLHPIWKV
ncbi:hypothetical protein ACIOUF_02345 [Pseudomonas iridis]|uniref:Uncharacterized protein n=1 Tax=Pseudomonas iridis TaxID=2710587 RepID=A0ABW8DFU6_9PSED